MTNEKPSASDWAAARGEKWLAHLAGTESMLAPIDALLLQALRLDAPYRIADIGCGGGGTTRAIFRHAPAGSVVHGFDISPALVESARSRVLPEERDVVFEVADVSMTAPEERYDRLLSRFGIMFFDEPAAAFANLARWVVPGGRFAFAVWGAPSENPWMTTVRDVVSPIVDVPSIDPEAPGAFRYADASKLFALLERAGFGELEVQDWRGALPIGGELPAREAAHYALVAFSSFGELLAKAGEQAFHQAHQSLTSFYAQREHDGAVRMGASVHIVQGVRSISR